MTIDRATTTGLRAPRSRRHSVRLGLTLLATALATWSGIGASPASASTSWEYAYFEGRSSPAALADRDGNGRFDIIYFDLSDNGRWDAVLYNARGSDSVLDRLLLNPDENGSWDYWLEDVDQQNGFDQLYVNSNGSWQQPSSSTTIIPITVGGPFHPISDAYVSIFDRAYNTWLTAASLGIG